MLELCRFMHGFSHRRDGSDASVSDLIGQSLKTWSLGLRSLINHSISSSQEARFPSYASPQKRLVAWQPMKRSSGPAEVELDREAGEYSLFFIFECKSTSIPGI